MQQVCPITDRRVNERVARVNALIIFVLITSFLIFKSPLILAFLVVDFLTRGFLDGSYSIVSRLSSFICRKLELNVKMINAGPKIFAAQVGLVLTLLTLSFLIKGCNVVCFTAGAVLGLFSLLEAVFGFCLACKIYPLFRSVVE